MARRSFSKPSQVQVEGSKPSLESVLDLYAVSYSSRTTQMVRCPVHGDHKTPSCSINLEKQVWNCHSCGAAGDSWELIKRMEGVDLDGARTFAAANGLADADVGGGGGFVRGGADSGGSRIPTGKGTDQGKRAYAPTWSRR